ncbi:MAG: response regulator transcription factor [Gammaproteobacteria bacterium]|nr:response regulator transcription factor [Gammaproteobacteria bacterium]
MTESRPAPVVGDATVFVVDDDEGVRHSLAILLDTAGYRTKSFASATEFLAQYDSGRSGCLLLDMRMPGMSGMELLHALGQRGAFLPVIFITGHGDVPLAVEAMKDGAFDFLQKPFAQQDLLERVGRAIASDAEARATLGRTEEIRRRYGTLTPREREVMSMIVDGSANKVIAMDLKLSERTVEIHRSRVMEKMATRSVAHLVKMAMAMGGPDRLPAG